MSVTRVFTVGQVSVHLRGRVNDKTLQRSPDLLRTALYSPSAAPRLRGKSTEKRNPACVRHSQTLGLCRYSELFNETGLFTSAR